MKDNQSNFADIFLRYSIIILKLITEIMNSDIVIMIKKP
jgi:hypothetical protein